MNRTAMAYVTLLGAIFLLPARPANPQAATPAASAETERTAAGDSPADPGPLATGLSHSLKPKDIQAAMRKVADWQLRTGEQRFNQQWTFAPLYDGLIAASRTTGDPRYRDAVLACG